MHTRGLLKNLKNKIATTFVCMDVPWTSEYKIPDVWTFVGTKLREIRRSELNAIVDEICDFTHRYELSEQRKNTNLIKTFVDKTRMKKKTN